MIDEIDRFRGMGSAKALVGDQKILFVFVDDDGASAWTPEQRKPVEVKIERSLRWLETKAEQFRLRVRFHHSCIPFWPSIACHSGTHIDETDFRAGPSHSAWQNTVATRLTKHGSVATRWQELFEAGKLPLDGSDGSAVVFCVRRWVPSVAFPFTTGQDVEFEKERAIIYDNGGELGQWYLDSLISHELLHLYGAVDLAPAKAAKSLQCISDLHRDDVMHTPTARPIENYVIGDVTAYLIGWSQEKPACLT